MNRVVQFVRSLLPTDPAQLLLLAGLVCLTVVPGLNWLPSDNTSLVADLAYAGHTSPREIRQSLFMFLDIASYIFMFAASAGFFTSCWPGKRPARRIFWFVVLPAVVGLCAVCARYLSLLAAPRSVLQRGSVSDHGALWMISKLWNLGIAFHFCVVGLVLIVAFALQRARGKTAPPISIALHSVGAAEDTDAWKGCKKCI